MTINLWWSFWWKMELTWMYATMKGGLHSMPLHRVDLQKLPGILFQQSKCSCFYMLHVEIQLNFFLSSNDTEFILLFES